MAVTFAFHKHYFDDEVKDILKRSRIEGDFVYLPETLARDKYVKVNKVLNLLGGQWNRTGKGHKFPEPCKVAFDEMLETGEVIDKKKTYQFFPTPKIIAHYMAEKLSVLTCPGATLLEPSAGTGVLCLAAEAHGISKEKISVCEIQDDLREKLAANYKVRGTDFLAAKPKVGEGFDRIIMNPPFGNSQDVTHVKHAYWFLKRGGVMVSITSPSWQHAWTEKNNVFKEWFLALQGIGKAELEELPPGTFSESGTEVRSLLLVITKP